MALTEQKVAVNHNRITDSLEVLLANQILRDGAVIAETPHRGAYNREQKALFEADLGADAAAYITMAGW